MNATYHTDYEVWQSLLRYIQNQQQCQIADAEDLTQDVLRHLLRKGAFDSPLNALSEHFSHI